MKPKKAPTKKKTKKGVIKTEKVGKVGLLKEIKRVHYYDQQFLREGDFAAEQKYHMDMRRRLNRTLHSRGIIEGLTIRIHKDKDNVIVIDPGMAVDASGREIVLLQPEEIVVDNQYEEGSAYAIALKYGQEYSDPPPLEYRINSEDMSRVRECPRVDILKLEKYDEEGEFLLELNYLELLNLIIGLFTIKAGARQVIIFQDYPRFLVPHTFEGMLGIGLDTPTQRLSVLGNGMFFSRFREQELITNGSFDDETSWSFGLGWSWDEDNHAADFTPPKKIEGSRRMWPHALSQDVSGLEKGRLYGLSFEVINRTTGFVWVRVGGAWGNAVTENGISSQVIPASTQNRQLAFFPSNDFDGAITKVSLVYAVGGDIYAGDIYAGDIYADNVYTSGKGGYVIDQFVNGMGEELEEGDIVVIGNKQTSLYYGSNKNIPVPEVDTTNQAYDTRVCGIVVEVHKAPRLAMNDERGNPRTNIDDVIKDNIIKKESSESMINLLQAKRREEPKKEARTKVQPGQTGWMVTLGAFAHCKVDADIAPIEVGDLLTTSPTKGHAQKVLEPTKAIGAILGKGLGTLKKGKGKIPVLLVLQ